MINIHEALVHRCKNNEVDAQKELYHSYSKAMYNLCLRMTGNRMDAEDCLQEGFIKAFKRIHSFKGESSFGAWLKRIVINQCINFLKQKKQVNWQDLNEQLMASSNEHETSVVSSHSINQAIQQLPTGCRTIFTLKIMEGYDHQEISQILSISVSTSKSQLHRAKELLRTTLSKTAQL